MTDRSPTEKAGDKTRARILAYAGNLFFERGFRKVSIEELCAGMALSKRTFYKYFPNRDAVVEALITERLAQNAPALMENLASDHPVREILARHFELLINNILKKTSLQFMADLQALMPEFWDRIEQFRQIILQKVAELIRRGQQDGSIRPDFDPTVLGKIFQAIVTHVGNPTFAMAQGVSLEQIVTTLQKVFMHGVLMPPPETKTGDSPKIKHRAAPRAKARRVK